MCLYVVMHIAYVYMHAYSCLRACKSAYGCVWVRACICVPVVIHVQMYACMCICIYVHTRAYIHAYMYVKQMHLCVYIYKHM